MSVVSIIGRPNTGKSTLFNRLISSRNAIVHKTPNLTRDRHYGQFSWLDKEFVLIDTGGIGEKENDAFIKLVEQQADIAINESDIIIFLVDNKQGLMPDDYYIAEKLRRAKKKVILVINKCDNPDEIIDGEFYKLGFDSIIAISAEHAINTNELKNLLIKFSLKRKIKEYKGIKVAILGKPNTGKSSLINVLLNNDRMIVSEIPGTTRDSVNSLMKYKKKTFILIDTAGIRKLSKIKEPTEYYTILRSKLSLRKCDIAIIMIDASLGISRQDKNIIKEVIDSLKLAIIVFNKTDIINVENRNEYYEHLKEDIEFASHLPIIFSSVKNKKNVFKILDKAIEIYDNYPKEFKRSELNKVLFKIISKKKSPLQYKKHIRFYKMYQKRVTPLIFCIELNKPSILDNTYKRYIMNSIRKELNIQNISFAIDYSEKKR